jgi:hypothetical protein
LNWKRRGIAAGGAAIILLAPSGSLKVRLKFKFITGTVRLIELAKTAKITGVIPCCQPQNRQYYLMNFSRGGVQNCLRAQTTRLLQITVVRGDCMQSRTVAEKGKNELSAELRQQDDKFRERLRAAIENGREFCPTGVNTDPGTQRPVVGYTRPD